MTGDGPVLVVGGTGMLGSQVVAELLSRGKHVRALVRKDMAAMAGWFQSGRYIPDTTRQREVFGAVPTAEDAVARLVTGLGHTVSPRGTDLG